MYVKMLNYLRSDDLFAHVDWMCFPEIYPGAWGWTLGLSVGATYVTRVDAILLARRGMIDEVANPRYTLERFQPNRDYNPYDTMPLGTITKGTLIRVERLGVFKDGTISVIGQIQSGPFVAEDRSAYSMARMITGPPRRTGRIVFNELVGGKHWSESAFAEHLEILP
jgi:hypothetical protein